MKFSKSKTASMKGAIVRPVERHQRTLHTSHGGRQKIWDNKQTLLITCRASFALTIYIRPINTRWQPFDSRDIVGASFSLYAHATK